MIWVYQMQLEVDEILMGIFVGDDLRSKARVVCALKDCFSILFCMVAH